MGNEPGLDIKKEKGKSKGKREEATFLFLYEFVFSRQVIDRIKLIIYSSHADKSLCSVNYDIAFLNFFLAQVSTF